MARLSHRRELEIDVPSSRPVVPLEEYAQRLERTTQLMTEHSLDHLVVYGDRERGGDLHFLTGFDPRFEEAVLVLGSDGSRTLLLGNENMTSGPHAELGITLRLFQELSPQGQFRHRPTSVGRLLEEAGVVRGSAVGIVGGKYFTEGFVEDPARTFSVPSYIVDSLRSLVGDDRLVNAQSLFVNPQDGLRSINSAHQIAEYEYASSIASSAVRDAMRSIAVGSRADLVASRLDARGLESSMHAIVNFGEKVKRGLTSPSSQQAQLGDAYQVAFGVRGALTCRSGMIARGAEDLPAGAAEFFDAVTCNYFDVLVAWYESLAVGAIAGDVFAAADAARDAFLFDFSLNPGHTLQFEEWLDSPFRAGDASILPSGAALQGDIIPVAHGPFIGVNIEDGVVLADDPLRERIADLFPEAHERIARRRDYLRDEIGVELHPSVLPLSNTPLWHAPYLLSPDLALSR
jgi:hypothetical protein